MTFSEQLYLDLSNAVYNSTTTNIDGYNQIILPGQTNEQGYYNFGGLGGGFTCAAYKNGDNVVISFRGTNDFTDLFYEDLNIILGNIPDQFHYAQEFYNYIKFFFPDANISFTGHSLGGGIAQLMGAKYGLETVTFNAPGMLNMLDQIGLSNQINYTNITNYSIINDYVGNFRTHVGDTYYIQPVPIANSPLFDTHMAILNYTEANFGDIFSKPTPNVGDILLGTNGKI